MATVEEWGIETSPHPFPALCEHRRVEKSLRALTWGTCLKCKQGSAEQWSRVSFLSSSFNSFHPEALLHPPGTGSCSWLLLGLSVGLGSCQALLPRPVDP